MGQTKHFNSVVYFLHICLLHCYAGPLEEISSMPDLTTVSPVLSENDEGIVVSPLVLSAIDPTARPSRSTPRPIHPAAARLDGRLHHLRSEQRCHGASQSTQRRSQSTLEVPHRSGSIRRSDDLQHGPRETRSSQSEPVGQHSTAE